MKGIPSSLSQNTIDTNFEKKFLCRRQFFEKKKQSKKAARSPANLFYFGAVSVVGKHSGSVGQKGLS